MAKFNDVWRTAVVNNETLKLPLDDEIVKKVQSDLCFGEYDVEVQCFTEEQAKQVLVPSLLAVISKDNKR